MKDAEIGARARALREAQGKSLDDVCREAGDVPGLNPSRLSMKERGLMGWSPDQISAAARVLNTTAGYLFDGVGDTDDADDTDPVPQEPPAEGAPATPG